MRPTSGCHRRPLLGSLRVAATVPGRLRLRRRWPGHPHPYKQPADGRRLAVDNRTYNTALRSMRCHGERGFAILTGRWRTLRHSTTSPRNLGDVVRAALHLTHFEHRYLPDSC
ncbi:transposase family protein [Micromonospora sp. NBC_01655]|uniref:transposase family protein n=1 Tax=Micromonospora sp. NBC_01655 TaxID=2975983 RepID=UPI002B1CDE84|nr:transposase family protein [Micromonospora sp. NBC_01655]